MHTNASLNVRYMHAHAHTFVKLPPPAAHRLRRALTQSPRLAATAAPRAADVKAATSTSQAVIAAGASGGVAFLLAQRHPEDVTVPLIDYSLAAVLTPPILFGVSTGVLLNVLFPDWLLTVLLTVLLLLLAYRPMRMVRSAPRLWGARGSAQRGRSKPVALCPSVVG